MGWRPRLNIICGRCGKPSGLGHVCVSNSRKPMTLKPTVSFGKCPTCRRAYGPGGAMTHHCAPKSDFGRRKKKFEQEQRAKARKKRPAHDYTECSDGECKRSRCVAYKAGVELGEQRGYDRGWEQGHERGVADCPRDHK